MLCSSVNLPYSHAWNTVVMSGLVPLVATWNCLDKLGQKNILVSTIAGDEKNLHLGSRKFIFYNRFSGDIIFSSLVSFAFFILVFVVVVF